MKRYAIIVAGGRGQRMKSSVPKQFLELNHKPVLMHTIEKFYSVSSSIHIVVVLPKSYHGVWITLCDKHQFNIPHQICDGGSTRFQSVKKGLAHCKEEGIIAVHDGVRPLIHSELIQKSFRQSSITPIANSFRSHSELVQNPCGFHPELTQIPFRSR